MANPLGVLLRESLFHDYQVRLAQLAGRTHQRGMSLKSFVVVLIDTDEACWRPLLDALRPNEDWSKLRDDGGEAMMRGTVHAEAIYRVVRDNVPDLVSLIQGDPPPGQVRAFVMAGGGISCHLLTPDPNATLPS